MKICSFFLKFYFSKGLQFFNPKKQHQQRKKYIFMLIFKFFFEKLCKKLQFHITMILFFRRLFLSYKFFNSVGSSFPVTFCKLIEFFYFQKFIFSFRTSKSGFEKADNFLFGVQKGDYYQQMQKIVDLLDIRALFKNDAPIQCNLTNFQKWLLDIIIFRTIKILSLFISSIFQLKLKFIYIKDDLNK
ncbi:unnamed protein product [Paramecium primaurelia]|uniref:Uncharacterized protein n=1 Tax=Paramecium primaurelia TaxID=5886 RepID=A0A8S1L7L6_PARPR|nr:unnamed protein product [Paramecium primaurelia]